MERTSATNISFYGPPRNITDGRQQNSTPTSPLSGTQRISQEQQSASEACMTAATGAGERRIGLGVLPVKVNAKGGTQIAETYALLDGGNEVTLCKEQQFSELGTQGSKLQLSTAESNRIQESRVTCSRYCCNVSGWQSVRRAIECLDR